MRQPSLPSLPCSRCEEEPRKKGSSWGKKCLAKARKNSRATSNATRHATSGDVMTSPDATSAVSHSPDVAYATRGGAPAKGTESVVAPAGQLSPVGGSGVLKLADVLEAKRVMKAATYPPAGTEVAEVPNDQLSPAGGADIQVPPAKTLRPGRRQLNRVPQESGAPGRAAEVIVDPEVGMRPASVGTAKVSLDPVDIVRSRPAAKNGDNEATRLGEAQAGSIDLGAPSTSSGKVPRRGDHTECRRRIDELLEEVGRLKGELAKRPVPELTVGAVPVPMTPALERAAAVGTLLNERLKRAGDKAGAAITEIEAQGPEYGRGRGKVTFEKRKEKTTTFPCAGPGRCRVLGCPHEVRE